MAPADDSIKMRELSDKEVAQLKSELGEMQRENRQLRAAIDRSQREASVSEEKSLGGGNLPDFKASSLETDSLRAENTQLKEKVKRPL